MGPERGRGRLGRSWLVLAVVVCVQVVALDGRAQVLEDLVSDLQSSDDAVRRAAGNALFDTLEDRYAELLPLLLPLIDDPEEQVRYDAAKLLLAGSLASTENAGIASGASAAYLSLLEGPSGRLRLVGVEGLGRILPGTPPEAVSALIARVGDDPDPTVRAAALHTLGRLEAPTGEVTATLVGALESGAESRVRGAAAEGLGRLRVTDPQVVSALVAALSDSDPFVRQEVISALAQLGGTSTAAIEALQSVADTDEDPLIRELAIAAIATIESANGPPDCSQAVASPALLWPPNHELNTVEILGVTDPDGDAFTIQVTEVVQDEGVVAGGSGNTCPDAVIDGAEFQFRSERVGNENGRVYRASFTAMDVNGAVCSGTVRVCTPHEEAEDPTSCVEDPLIYDSLVCP